MPLLRTQKAVCCAGLGEFQVCSPEQFLLLSVGKVVIELQSDIELQKLGRGGDWDGFFPELYLSLMQRTEQGSGSLINLKSELSSQLRQPCNLNWLRLLCHLARHDFECKRTPIRIPWLVSLVFVCWLLLFKKCR